MFRQFLDVMELEPEVYYRNVPVLRQVTAGERAILPPGEPSLDEAG